MPKTTFQWQYINNLSHVWEVHSRYYTMPLSITSHIKNPCHIVIFHIIPILFLWFENFSCHHVAWIDASIILLHILSHCHNISPSIVLLDIDINTTIFIIVVSLGLHMMSSTYVSIGVGTTMVSFTVTTIVIIHYYYYYMLLTSLILKPLINID